MKFAVGAMLLLVGMVGQARAAAITYRIDFTAESGNAPESGSFTYDVTASANAAFSNFIVRWNNIDFDMTSAANNPQIFGQCATPATGGHATFTALFSGTNPCSGPMVWLARRININTASFSFRDNADGTTSADPQGLLATITKNQRNDSAPDGTGTFAATAIPEPTPTQLIGSGVALMLALRQGWRKTGKAETK